MKKWIGIPSAAVLLGAGLAFLLFARPAKQDSRTSAPHDAEAKKIAYYRDPMQPWITSDKPGKAACGMDLVPVYARDPSVTGIHIDPTMVQNMNVQTATVEKMDLRTEVRTSGRIEAEETRLADVNVRVMGYVEKLRVDYTGQRVDKNQTLLDLYSPDLVSTQEEYLEAIRSAGLRDPGAGGGPQELVESSRRRLVNWGISAAEIRALEKRGRVNHTLPIVSPARGVVLEKKVVEGQNVLPGMELYKIADLSRVWVVASVYQSDLSAVRVGMRAEVELSYLPGKTYAGRVIFVAPVLDAQSKTGEVRIELKNTPSLDLKPGMFATVRLRSPARKNVVAVPEQAILRTGRRDLAVIALGNGYFEPRAVKLGVGNGEYVQVLEGIRAGEKIVVSSQFLIDAESNLNAAIRQMQAAPAGNGPGTSSAPSRPDTSAAAMN